MYQLIIDLNKWIGCTFMIDAVVTLILLHFVMRGPLIRRYDPDLIERLPWICRGPSLGAFRAGVYAIGYVGSFFYKMPTKGWAANYDFRRNIGPWKIPAIVFSFLAAVGLISMIIVCFFMYADVPLEF